MLFRYASQSSLGLSRSSVETYWHSLWNSFRVPMMHGNCTRELPERICFTDVGSNSGSLQAASLSFAKANARSSRVGNGERWSCVQAIAAVYNAATALILFHTSWTVSKGPMSWVLKGGWVFRPQDKLVASLIQVMVRSTASDTLQSVHHSVMCCDVLISASFP